MGETEKKSCCAMPMALEDVRLTEMTAAGG